MAVLVVADFVPMPRLVEPASLVLQSVHRSVTAGHVGVASEARADFGEGDGELVNRGTFNCPCEIDVRLSDVLDITDKDPYAFEFYFEPLESVTPRIDVELHRKLEGRPWFCERLLEDCRDGITRTKPVRRLAGEKLRLRMVFTADVPDERAPVRVWMREPKRRHQLRAGAGQKEASP